MFYRVQAKAVTVGLFHDPTSPIFNLFRNRVIAKIDIFPHQIVEITQLIINLIVPAIAGIVIDDLKNAVFVGILDVINAAETVIVPNKVGILARAGREGVARPAFAFNDVVIDLRAVILIHALNADTFFFVCAHFVVHDDVEQHRNIIFLSASIAVSNWRLSPYFVAIVPFWSNSPRSNRS